MHRPDIIEQIAQERAARLQSEARDSRRLRDAQREERERRRNLASRIAAIFRLRAA